MLPLIAALALTGPETLVLSRGASLPNEPFRYWSVADTTLDSANSASAGGDYELSGGSNRVVLIRFGDLDRAVAGRKVLGARLIFHVSDGAAVLASISKVKSPWGEGPVSRPSFMKPLPGEAPAGRGAATWRSRIDDVADWQMPGAAGPEDTTPIDGAKLSQLENGDIAIEGIGQAVGQMATKWYENFGFALRFQTSVMFESSQAAFRRPKLELTLGEPESVKGPNLAVLPIEAKDGGDSWEVTAKVKNLGDAPSGSFRLVWLNETRGGVMSENNGLAPQAETVFTNRVPKHGQEPRFATLSLRIYPQGQDADPSDDQADCYLGGVPVEISESDWKVGVRAARFVNETVFGQSRFSFARDGVTKRVNPVLSHDANQSDFGALVRSMAVKAGAVDTRASSTVGHPYGEGMLGGETRCDSILFPQISLPTEPYFTPVLDNGGLETTDLLGMTQVAALNGVPSGVPKVLLVRPVSRMGLPYQGVTLTFYKVGDESIPAATLPGTPSETLLLPTGLYTGDMLLTVYRVQATLRGTSCETYQFGWQFLDCFVRGSQTAAIIDIPVDLPTLDLGENNMVDGKLVSDSAGRSLDELSVLTKEGNTAPVKFSGKRGTWVEVDLGRDRTGGELILESKNLPKGLDILIYETGQKPSDAQFWARETDARWRLLNRPAGGGIILRPAPNQFRFLRIVSRYDQEDWELTNIRLKSAKVEP